MMSESSLSKRLIRKVERDVYYRYLISGRRPYVGIGLQKTGTTSLYIFMSWLGFKTKHYVPDIFCDNHLGSNETCPIDNLLDLSMPNISKYLDEYNFLDDNPFGKPDVIERILQHNPKMKFISTERSSSDWAKSVMKHIKQPYYVNQFNYRIKNYPSYKPDSDIILTANNIGILEYMYEVPYTSINEEFLLKYYADHLDYVQSLADRLPNQVLRIQTEDDPKVNASLICQFMGIRTPLFFTFPHAKKTT